MNKFKSSLIITIFFLFAASKSAQKDTKAVTMYNTFKDFKQGNGKVIGKYNSFFMVSKTLSK